MDEKELLEYFMRWFNKADERQAQTEIAEIYKSFAEKVKVLSKVKYERVIDVLEPIVRITSSVNVFLQEIEVSDEFVEITAKSQSLDIEKENYDLLFNAVNLCDDFDMYQQESGEELKYVCLSFKIRRDENDNR